MPSPRVSVLMPLYNGEENVGRALDSVLSQTEGEIEVVVIDDGSTDRSADVVSTFPHVKLLRQANCGIGATRQRLIEEASADWIAFIDHDDEWMANKLERQMSLVDEGRVVLASTDCIVKTPAGESQEVRWSPRDARTPLDHLLPTNRVWTSSVVVRKDAIRTHGFQLDMSRAEDWLAWFGVAAVGDFGRIEEVLTVRHERTLSASTPGLAWYLAERRVLQEFVLPHLDSWYTRFRDSERERLRKLVHWKLGIIASLEAECLDKAKRRPEARKRHIEALRAAPTKGALLRFAKHLVRR